MFWYIVFALIFLPICIVTPIKIYGKKNIEKKKNYIIVCNHQSNFDGIILETRLRRDIRFVAKIELWKGKKHSFLYDSILNCIPVDRSKGLTLSATKQIYQTLQNNKCVGFFPEGTRNTNIEENSQIKSGACLFAIKTKTPVLPCYILKKQKLFKKNVLLIGKPFELTEFYNKKLDKETLADAGDLLLKKILELKEGYQSYTSERELVKKLKKAK